ncbi:MAG TPA: response regulator [Polyangiaceae bacterium]
MAELDAGMKHALVDPMLPKVGESGVVLRPGRVLLIDDDSRFGHTIQDVLSERHDVVVALNATDALALLLGGERYDVILCDIRMPGVDGIELHRRLHAALPREAARVVFVTSDPEAPDVLAYFKRVPNLVLAKPIELADLESLIDRAIRAHRPVRRSA